MSTITVDREFLEECRARLSDLLSATNEQERALRLYFSRGGANHSAEDCAEDETCECEEIVAMDVARATLSKAENAARRRINRIDVVLAAGGGNMKVIGA